MNGQKKTDMSTGFTGEAEEDIEGDSELESLWARWGPRDLVKEFHQLTCSMITWKEKHHGG